MTVGLASVLKRVDVESFQFDEKTATLFDDLVKAFGGIGWEIGPDIVDPRRASFSVNVGLSASRLSKVAKAIATLPRIPDWVIYVGLPPKDWEMYFELEDEDGSPTPVEGRDWKWMADISSKSLANLKLLPPSRLSRAQRKLKNCAEIIVIGEIGERNCIKLLHGISLATHQLRSGVTRRMGTFAADFAKAFDDAEFRELLLRKKDGVVERKKR